MTENEAIKLHISENIHRIEVIEDFLMTNSDANDKECRKNIDILTKINKALEDVLQYCALEKRLSDMFCSSVSLKSVVDELERNLKEPDSPHPMKARILTYKESADWDAYRAIGTPEECLRNKDFLRFLANSMNQEKYETYLRIYNAVEKEGRDE